MLSNLERKNQSFHGLEISLVDKARTLAYINIVNKGDRYMRQIQIIELGEDHAVEYDVWICSSDNQQSLEIIRHLPDGESYPDSANGSYSNVRQLSEALRDAIGYGPAFDLLTRNGVDANDPLMYLGVNNDS